MVEEHSRKTCTIEGMQPDHQTLKFPLVLPEMVHCNLVCDTIALPTYFYYKSEYILSWLLIYVNLSK